MIIGFVTLFNEMLNEHSNAIGSIVTDSYPITILLDKIINFQYGVER